MHRKKLRKTNLNEISLPIKVELAKFNTLFKQSLKSKVALVDLIAKYILKQKGKRVRPILVLLASKIAGGISERSYRGATLVELLHTATLVHDDVVDSAEKRRGLPSINAIWKNKVGVLMGDYLLSRGLMFAVEYSDFDFLQTVTDTVRRMSEGELLQISKTKKLDIDEKTYYKIISDKTSSLLSTCCVIGAKSATDNEDIINTLRNYGEYLGMAFQIRDDILDYIGTSNLIGKPLGGDIKEKKITLPLIYSLNKTDGSQKTYIRKLIKKNNKKDNVQKIINFVKVNDGIKYASEVASRFAEKSKKQLEIFPDSEAKLALQMLIDFVVNREK